MELVVLGSSSNGNCYLLKNDQECLIIECGINPKDVKRALGFTLTKVAGCILTHEHGDHAKYANDIMDMGVTIYASAGTLGALPKTGSKRTVPVNHSQRINIGRFMVIPFNVEHDCAEPLGFLIYHPDCGTVLFATDTYYLHNTFSGLNHVIIEANYSQEIVQKAIANGYLPDFRAKRLFKSHMSLETCIQTLKANDLSKVQTITLIHLSDRNSNADFFQKKVTAATGKPVTIADAGVIIELNKRPF